MVLSHLVRLQWTDSGTDPQGMKYASLVGKDIDDSNYS